jgi:hypothetical protein
MWPLGKKPMSTIFVKNATVGDGEPLCRTCTHAHIQKGYRECEETIFCTYGCWNQPRLVPFKVRDCTDYTDRDTPSRHDLEEMALLIEPATSGKRAGFRIRPAEAGEDGEDAELGQKN